MVHSYIFRLLLIFFVVHAVPVQADELATATQHLRAGEYQKAFVLLKPLAESGNATAQQNLGIMYLNGDGVPRDFDRSRAWLEKAAVQGQVPSMAILGRMHLGAQGHPQDRKLAANWLKQAAEANDVESINRLGILLYEQKEYAQALVWFRKAADRNHPESQSFLGDLYRFGRAVKLDNAEAIRWYEKSATKNYPHALYMLAVMNGQGLGTPADRAKANAYYERAAAAGYPPAKKYMADLKTLPEPQCVTPPEAAARKDELGIALANAIALIGDPAAAAPALGKLAEQYPNDMVVQRCLGQTLVKLSTGETDAKKGEEHYRRARAAFQKAHELGDTSPITKVGFEGTEKPYFFDTRPVAAVVREGEAAFGRSDFLSAARHYQRALQLDPKHYEAALFSGDSYLRLKDWGEAGRWFAKAIAINPARETAYRYWGDALVHEGKRAEARDKFIDALIAEPHNSNAHRGLKQWAQHYRVRLEAPLIQIPVQEKNGTVSFDDKRITAYWVAYGMARALPVKDGNALRHEVEALKASLQVARELGVTATEKDTSLANLLRLEERGLLEPYVLFHRPTKEIFAQYADYRKEHRDLLRRYWLEEVIKE